MMPVMMGMPVAMMPPMAAVIVGVPVTMGPIVSVVVPAYPDPACLHRGYCARAGSVHAVAGQWRGLDRLRNRGADEKKRS